MIEMQPALPEAGAEALRAAHGEDRLSFPQAAGLIVLMSLGCWCAIAMGLAMLLP